jgi:hypothetical protein
MKVLVSSLAAVVVLGILVSLDTAHAQATWACMGPFSGCPDANCASQPGMCPITNLPFAAVVTVTPNVYNCLPPGNGCSLSTRQPFCAYLCYESIGIMTGVCLDFVCSTSDDVDQCPQHL